MWPESKSFRDEGLGPIPSRWKGICQNQKDATFHCNRFVFSLLQFLFFQIWCSIIFTLSNYHKIQTNSGIICSHFLGVDTFTHLVVELCVFVSNRIEFTIFHQQKEDTCCNKSYLFWVWVPYFNIRGFVLGTKRKVWLIFWNFW